MLQAMLYEPQCVPPLPDLMLLDEEEPCHDAWSLGLASFGAPGGSAPVPIARAPHATPSAVHPLGAELDSVESTQTLLGASLAEAGSAAASHGTSYHASPMRFVPVPVAPAPPPPPPQALYLQPQPQQYRGLTPEPYGTAPTDARLFDGYGVVAEPQALPFPGASAQPVHHSSTAYEYHHGRRPAAGHGVRHHHHQHAPQQYGGDDCAWELPQERFGAGAAHGISAFDMAYPFSARFGSQMPQQATRFAPSSLPADVLEFGNYRGGYSTSAPAYQSVLGGQAGHPRQATAYGSAPTEGHLALAGGRDSMRSMGSESSDEDVLDPHHHASAGGSLPLERCASSRRLVHSPSAPRGLGASPRTKVVCLKVKAPRARPGAARAAAAAAEEAGGRLPARHAARRSMALSNAALAEEEAFADSDSEAEGTPSAAASYGERASAGGSAGAGAAAGGAAAAGKKKHNPWSLAETEGLVEGVRLLGPSKWAEIKKLGVGGIAALLATRSAVDLKDKWRNLTRVAKLPKSVLKARAHKSTSDIPLDLLLTVKELMEASRD